MKIVVKTDFCSNFVRFFLERKIFRYNYMEIQNA